MKTKQANIDFDARNGVNAEIHYSFGKVIPSVDRGVAMKCHASKTRANNQFR